MLLRRWSIRIGNAFDRWLWKTQIEPVGNTNWRSLLIGIIAGVCSGGKCVVTEIPSIEKISFYIAGSAVIIIAVVYLAKTLRQIHSSSQKILRALFVLGLCSVNFVLGFFLGVLFVQLFVLIVVLCFFVIVLFSILCSGGRSSTGGIRPKKRYTLDDGTELEEVGNNIYEDVSSYTRYRKGTFTDEFTKIDW